jgi:hypothetical protein
MGRASKDIEHENTGLSAWEPTDPQATPCKCVSFVLDVPLKLPNSMQGIMIEALLSNVSELSTVAHTKGTE